MSILSPLSKVRNFSRNKIFHSNLMGYMKNRSTQTAVLQMYDRWVRGAVDGNINGVVLLELSAAFDMVCPEILIEFMEFMKTV